MFRYIHSGTVTRIKQFNISIISKLPLYACVAPKSKIHSPIAYSLHSIC